MNEPSLVAVLRYIADESILIGGTLARYASSGVKVSAVYLIDELEDQTPGLYVGRSPYTAQLSPKPTIALDVDEYTRQKQNAIRCYSEERLQASNFIRARLR